MAAQYPLDGNQYFDIREFIHPAFFNAVGPIKARWYISDFQRDFAFLLREVLDSPIELNDWYRGGRLVGKGSRPRSYKPKGGGEFSQHYAFNALDPSSKHFTPAQMLQKIMDNAARFEAIGLTTIESLEITPTWLHGDCRPKIKGIHPETGFLIVGPAK